MDRDDRDDATVARKPTIVNEKRDSSIAQRQHVRIIVVINFIVPVRDNTIIIYYHCYYYYNYYDMVVTPPPPQYNYRCMGVSRTYVCGRSLNDDGHHDLLLFQIVGIRIYYIDAYICALCLISFLYCALKSVTDAYTEGNNIVLRMFS